MEYQSKKLEEMVCYAYNHTRYYKRLLNSLNINPNVHSIIDYFAFIPVTNKRDYYNNPDDFISDEFDKSELEVVRTSGSTGKIFDIYWEKNDHAKSSLDMWRARNGYGISTKSRVCYFHTIVKTNIGEGESIITSPKTYMPNNHTLTFSKMQFNDNAMSFYYKKMQEFKPEWLLCYPTTLYLFTDFMIRMGLPCPESIRYIELMGEIVLPNHLYIIKKCFGPDVDIKILYGLQETNGIAVECKNGHMHILGNNAFLEIEKEGIVNRYAEDGNIIVTSLTNRAMPFIRYQTGDRGSLCQSSECNNNNDIIILKNGRLNELIRRNNDSPLEGNIFFYMVEYVNNIFDNCVKQFRIIQNGYNDFEVIFGVDDRQQLANVEKAFIEKAAQYGLLANWKFTYVDNIAPEENGKLRYFINRMDSTV